MQGHKFDPSQGSKIPHAALVANKISKITLQILP